MDHFVTKNSIVREIWGKSDTILFIFGGAAAEFALNKAVDWLYYTGKLPADPLGRLFSTVRYARDIVFSDRETANKTIDKITAIHGAVEKGRGAVIPDWAYRDVLFMLIHYSIAAYELLERRLTEVEKEEVFNVFYRVGYRMQLKGLPQTFEEWKPVRNQHLEDDLQKSTYTIHLYQQYRKALGRMRYLIMLQAQVLVVPHKVRELLGLKTYSLLAPAIPVYKIARRLHMDWLLKEMLLPATYKKEIKNLDLAATTA